MLQSPALVYRCFSHSRCFVCIFQSFIKPFTEAKQTVVIGAEVIIDLAEKVGNKLTGLLAPDEFFKGAKRPVIVKTFLKYLHPCRRYRFSAAARVNYKRAAGHLKISAGVFCGVEQPMA